MSITLLSLPLVAYLCKRGRNKYRDLEATNFRDNLHSLNDITVGSMY